MVISSKLTGFFTKYPEWYIVFAAGFLSIFTATGKSDIPLMVIVFLRFLVPLVILNANKIRRPRVVVDNIKATNLLSFVRALFVAGSQYTFFYCVKEASLFDANTLLNTAPIFILIIYFFYDRSFSLRKCLAVLIGFAGVVLIVRPNNAALNLAMLAGVASGFCWAISNFTQSLLLKIYSNERCMFYYYFYGTLISFIVLLLSSKVGWLYTGMSFKYVLVIILFSTATISFQYFTGKAYAIKSAFELSPYLYLAILFSWLIDLFFFKQVTPFSSMVGAVLIFLAMMISRKSNIRWRFINKKRYP